MVKSEKKEAQTQIKSTKSAYSYIKENIRKNLSNTMIQWRTQNSVVKIDKPSDIGKARMLGYKDKKGFIIARVRVKRGGRKRHRVNHNRRSVRQTVRKNLLMNYREVAERRVAVKFPNLEVLNSYQVGKDGVSYFFEVILIDVARPEILADKNISWIASNKNRGRVFRGLTFAGQKGRGLRR